MEAHREHLLFLTESILETRWFLTGAGTSFCLSGFPVQLSYPSSSLCWYWVWNKCLLPLYILRQIFFITRHSQYFLTLKKYKSVKCQRNFMLLRYFKKDFKKGQRDGLVVKGDCLQARRPSSIHRMHMVKGKNWLPQVILWPPHTCLGTFACVHTQIS